MWAAAAALGAALLGISVLGGQIGSARADSGQASAASDSGTANRERSRAAAAKSDDTDEGKATTRDASGARDADVRDADAESGTDADNDVEADAEPIAELDSDADSDDDRADTEVTDADADLGTDDGTGPPAQKSPGRSESDPPAEPPAPPYESPQSEYEQWAGGVLDTWTTRHRAWVDSLQVSETTKQQLQTSFLAMRRTFFNQAPTVAPIQITGVIAGPITGTIGATDPDGDRLIYVMSKAPSAGTVTIGRDGTYTYIPDEGFDGVDTFYVRAIDLGLHVNLLQPLRPQGSGLATSLINQGAIDFDFTYTEGADYWDDERRDALQRSANNLIQNLRVTKAVELSITVVGYLSPDSGTLAGGVSPPVDGGEGFWHSLVQHEIITGEDANGSAADGYIEVNFDNPWAFTGDDVPDDRWDFTTTMMHELMHTLGFNSFGVAPRNYFTFMQFVMSDQRKTLIGGDLDVDPELGPNGLGANNGLFFGGANAVEANGGRLVRLYTPSQYDRGSSIIHLDMETFSEYLMTPQQWPGSGPRALSPIEAGILRDLGYTVVPIVALPS